MADKSIRALLRQADGLATELYEKDFLLTWEKSTAELNAVLLLAEALEEMYRANISTRVFDGGLAVSNFRDKSTRTRFSFASAASLLGLTPQDLDEGKSQVSHGETVRETANMISLGRGTSTRLRWPGRSRTATARACFRNGRRLSTSSATRTTRPRAWPTCCTWLRPSVRSRPCAAKGWP